MGCEWDQALPGHDVWRECLRVCKPGAYLFAFGGSRTQHRLICAIEDGGWIIRDGLTHFWVNAQGFPKGVGIDKAIDKHLKAKRKGQTITAPATAEAKQWEGYNTALKPAWEIICVAQKPVDGTYANNCIKWGCGTLAIDATRIGIETRINPPAANKPGGNWYNLSLVGMPQDAEPTIATGRYSANTIFDDFASAQLDQQSGNRKSGGGIKMPERIKARQRCHTRQQDFPNMTTPALVATKAGPLSFFLRKSRKIRKAASRL